MKKILPWLLLVAIVFFQIVTMLFVANEKRGFHLDEFYTFGTANSTPGRNLFMAGDTDFRTERNPEFYNDYLTVQEDEKFHYDIAYRNADTTVHGPIYFFLIHTISSFDVDNFSKWHGIIVNVVTFVISNFVLYLISKKLIKNKYLALLPSFFWGFSIGAISMAVFIRMYMQFTLAALLLVYWHVKFKDCQQYSFTKIIPLILIMILGILSHAYFLIFAFFVAGFHSLRLLVGKKFKMLLIYCLTMLLSIGLSHLAFPSVLTRLQDSNRGIEAVENISTAGNFSNDIIGYLEVVNKSIFSGQLFWFLLAIFVLVMFFIIKNCSKKKYFSLNEKYLHVKLKIEKSFSMTSVNGLIYLAIIIFSALFYLLLVVKIAPYQTDRYIAPIFPILILAICVLMVWFNQVVNNGAKKSLVVLIVPLLIVGAIGLRNYRQIEYLYYDADITPVSDLKKYSDDTAFFFVSSDGPLRSQRTMPILILREHQRSHVITYNANDPDSLKQIIEFIDEITYGSDITVYFASRIDHGNREKILAEISESLNYKMDKQIFDGRGGMGYLLTTENQ